jgi:hypothetical protein
MVTKKTMYISLLFLLIVPCSGVSADEILRGDAMADKGKTVSRLGITFLPHVEIEKGLYSFNGGFAGEGEGSGTGLAYGVTVGRYPFYVDLYTRQHISSDEFELENYGANFSYAIARGDGYVACGVEEQRVEITDLYGSWKSTETRIKPGAGGVVRDTGNSQVQAGVGLIIGSGEADLDQQAYAGGKVFEGTADYTSFGWFVQTKYGRSLAERLFLTISLVAEGTVSLSDAEIQGETFQFDSLSLYFRAGFQYLF